MSKGEVDKYLRSLEQPKRGTLEALRRTILDIIPEAEQCISYGMPAFRVQGKVIAGFAAFKNHLSYLPHSGSVIPTLGDALSQYKTSKGALAREVVGEHVQCHLSRHFGQRLHEKVRRPHPHLQCAKRMLSDMARCST
jgi:uncharacterized protein YdhG (YjbR/CyaY superfamily)